VFYSKNLKPKATLSLFTSPSGIAYDRSNNRYYISGGNHIDVTDTSFNKIKRITRKRYHKPQDIGAYNGVVLSCIWPGGGTSYVDYYRVSDGGYLGSIEVPFGEIESACVNDGHLVILMSSGKIYWVNKRISIG